MPAPSPNKKVLSDLKASILNPALTSQFQCWFNPPLGVRTWDRDKASAGLGNGYDNVGSEFYSLSCSEANLPGSSLATHELNNDYSGVTERHVYRRQYDDRASFTFYVDHNYDIIYFFENWISFIVNEQFANANGIPGIQEPNHFYRVRFPKDYQTEIYIKKFEKDYTGRILQYRFLKAYPISIDSMPVSYDSSQLLKCTVSFSYSRYIVGGGEVLTDSIGGGQVVGRRQTGPDTFVEDVLINGQILQRTITNGSVITTGFEGVEIGDLT